MTQLLQTKAFARDWKKLTPNVRAYITSFLLSLTDEPQTADIKRLRGFDPICFRLRCGDYRVIFQRTEKGIELLRAAHRKDVYRP